MQKSVGLSNYSLKQSLHDSNDMAIVINKRTKIENSAHLITRHLWNDLQKSVKSKISQISR